MSGFVELTIEQGANFSTTVTVNDSNGSPTNLTNYDAAAQLRKSYYSTTATDFTVAVTDAAAGQITMSITSSNTANLTPGRYVYDLLITSPTNVKSRVIEGIATILPSVTR